MDIMSVKGKLIQGSIEQEDKILKNKWLKNGMLAAAVGCMAFVMTGCQGEQVLNTVLDKVNPKAEAEAPEEEFSIEPDVNVEKPELTVNLSGSRIYKTGEKAEELKVEAAASDNGAISYQWYKSLTNTNGGGTLIEGATQNTYTPPTEETGTVYYYAVATNNIENSANGVTSDTVEIIVSDNPEEAKKAAEEKAAEEKAAAEKDSKDKKEEKPAEEKPAENKPAEEKPAESKPAEEKPAENKPAEEKPAENKPAEGQPTQ